MRSLLVITATFIAAAAPALAHTGHEHTMLEGFGAGFGHPFGGVDHLLAMIAVGVWGAQQGGRAVWLVPLSFVAIMAVGGALGFGGIGIGGTENVIVASVLVLGAVVAAAVKPPLWIAMPLVGAFALFHGLAHGAELPQAADMVGYAAGFMVATALLHAAGITLAFALRKGAPSLALRVAGMAQIGAGVLLATGVI